MPREIVLGNGTMLVNFDKFYHLRDLYYPYVGMENHFGMGKGEVGLWVDGAFSWVGGDGWEITMRYQEYTLVAETEAVHTGLGVAIRFTDAVDCQENILLRRAEIENLADEAREFRVFFFHDFNIAGFDVGDTALYDPSTATLIHYKRDYYFLLNGRFGGQGIKQYSIRKRFPGGQGSRADAEDGVLLSNPADQGAVNSTVGLAAEIPPQGKEVLFFWVVAGRNFHEVWEKNALVLNEGPETLLKRTAIYWQNWVRKAENDFGDLPEEVVRLYRRSLLILRTQIDRRGAILAANDSDILLTNRDHYSYVWPRDGALVSYALDKAGYPELTVPFYHFAARTLSEGGYHWHKYNPEGSVGSSWQSWVRDGEFQLPIQEDETALVLWALWEHYRRHRNFCFLAELYPKLVKPAAAFMAGYRDLASGLPLPSYDLWEERCGIFTFTASAVYAGLRAASLCAALLGDVKCAARWEEAAEAVKTGILTELYSEELGRFIRGFYPVAGEKVTPDYTLDASLWGVWGFGVLPATDPRVVRTMEAVRDGLWVKTEVGGLARYANDYYFRRSDDIARVPGNPWFICTLWLAGWHVARAQCREDLAAARELIEWVVRYSLPTGIMAEQVHPYTGEPLSVAPLTWSHATFVQVVGDYGRRWCELGP